MPSLIKRIVLSLPLSLALLALGIAVLVALAAQAEPHVHARIGTTTHQVAAVAAWPLNPRQGAVRP